MKSKFMVGLTTAALAASVFAGSMVASAAPAVGEQAGFTEIEIFSDQPVDFINLSAVWFQPVPMSDGNGTTYRAEDYDLHLEADISALENNLGYGVGDWIPYLNVDFKVVSQTTGQVAAEGTFMPMAASDGPHYGSNIKLPNADTYDITFTIHSPGENGYLIHTDGATGPGGTLEDQFGAPKTYTFTGWQYTPQKW